MRIISAFCALYWLLLTFLLFFGFDPNEATIGCGFFISALFFVREAIE